jgi:hypothetical protein
MLVSFIERFIIISYDVSKSNIQRLFPSKSWEIERDILFGMVEMFGDLDDDSLAELHTQEARINASMLEEIQSLERQIETCQRAQEQREEFAMNRNNRKLSKLHRDKAIVANQMSSEEAYYRELEKRLSEILAEKERCQAEIARQDEMDQNWNLAIIEELEKVKKEVAARYEDGSLTGDEISELVERLKVDLNRQKVASEAEIDGIEKKLALMMRKKVALERRLEAAEENHQINVGRKAKGHRSLSWQRLRRYSDFRGC